MQRVLRFIWNGRHMGATQNLQWHTVCSISCDYNVHDSWRTKGGARLILSPISECFPSVRDNVHALFSFSIHGLGWLCVTDPA